MRGAEPKGGGRRAEVRDQEPGGNGRGHVEIARIQRAAGLGLDFVSHEHTVWKVQFRVVKGSVRWLDMASQTSERANMSDEAKDALSSNDLLKNSSLYREFQAEREEILKHKWIESEKAGRDIGFERALTDWIIKHRSKWRRSRQAATH